MLSSEGPKDENREDVAHYGPDQGGLSVCFPSVAALYYSEISIPASLALC